MWNEHKCKDLIRLNLPTDRNYPMKNCLLYWERIDMLSIWPKREYKSRRWNQRCHYNLIWKAKCLSAFSSVSSAAVCTLFFTVTVITNVVSNVLVQSDEKKKKRTVQPSSGASKPSYKEMCKSRDNLLKEHEWIGLAFEVSRSSRKIWRNNCRAESRSANTAQQQWATGAVTTATATIWTSQHIQLGSHLHLVPKCLADPEGNQLQHGQRF